MSSNLLRFVLQRVSPRYWASVSCMPASTHMIRFASTNAIDSPTPNNAKLDNDMPDETMSNPFKKEKRQCILCRYDVQVDYKNVRLLSQFISPYTGRLYDKHITGLCEKQHRALRQELSLARKYGLMSPYYRDLKYQDDPRLYDPTRPQRPNPY